MADQGVALDPAVERQLVEPFLGDLQRRLAGGRRPLLLLNGPVGAGKSTLAGALQRRAAARGLALAVASIDDLYLPWPERRRQLEGNPFAVTRVPPGSHDVALLCSALEAWRGGEVLRLPRFDKTLAQGQGDRSGWREQRADALLLEGWLLGCRPLGAAALAQLEPASLGSWRPGNLCWSRPMGSGCCARGTGACRGAGASRRRRASAGPGAAGWRPGRWMPWCGPACAPCPRRSTRIRWQDLRGWFLAGRRLGWRAVKARLSQSKRGKTLRTSPSGHLPCWGWWNWMGGVACSAAGCGSLSPRPLQPPRRSDR